MSFIAPMGEQSTISEIELLTGLNNLDVSPSGQFLRKIGIDSFENANPSVGTTNIDSLSDVTIAGSAETRQYLRFDGSEWVKSFILASDLPSNIPAEKIGNGIVNNAEFDYLNGVTSAIQVQINAKIGTIEVPIGDVNSLNTTFTVANEPNLVVIDGLIRRDTKGYDYSEGTIEVDPLIPPSYDIFSIY